MQRKAAARRPVRTSLLPTPEGLARLQAEHRHLTTVVRPKAEAALRAAGAVPCGPAGKPEQIGACAERVLPEQRIARLGWRSEGARLQAAEDRADEIVAVGSRVVIEDLDDGSREEYVLTSSIEANPSEGRLSDESPVGKAIAGHHRGDVVDVHAPHGIRHLRISGS